MSMKNKEIFIDGIDVSKCKYLTGVVNEEPYCSDVGESYHTYLCRNKECLYKKYKSKKQECEKWKNAYRVKEDALADSEEYCEELEEQKHQLKAENEKMSKGYVELTEIVSPYIDDFTGYNEELKGFDIVLCVKELMQQLNQFEAENEHLAEKEEEARHYLEESYNYKQALQEIYETIIEFAKKDILTFPDRKPKENYKFIQEQCAEPIRQILQILQKCEVLKDVK